MTDTELTEEDRVLLEEAALGLGRIPADWRSQKFVPRWIGTRKSDRARVVVLAPMSHKSDDPAAPCAHMHYTHERDYNSHPMPANGPTPADIFEDIVLIQ